ARAVVVALLRQMRTITASIAHKKLLEVPLSLFDTGYCRYPPVALYILPTGDHFTTADRDHSITDEGCIGVALVAAQYLCEGVGTGMDIHQDRCTGMRRMKRSRRRLCRCNRQKGRVLRAT